MPLKLIRMGEAIAKIDVEKKLKEEEGVERKVLNFVWRGCSYLEATQKESKNGKVWYCSLKDGFSNDAVPFSCQACDKYRLHKRLIAPQW